jgi:hypothetical protein
MLQRFEGPSLNHALPVLDTYMCHIPATCVRYALFARNIEYGHTMRR